MFLNSRTTASTKNYSWQINRLKEEINAAKAIVIGAGAGLSTSAGFTYTGERFQKYFADFKVKYGFADMYSGGFYPYTTLEEYWAYWSRYIYCNRYVDPPKSTYLDLLKIVKGKNYFIITTNVDHCFQKAGFDKIRLFYTQGDYGLWQCSKPCHAKTYANEDAVRQMIAKQRNLKIPAELIPKCPVCGAPMAMNLRCDDLFVQDEGWYAAAERYNDFIHRCQNMRTLFLELGIGYNTPGIIKYPFWQMTAKNSQAAYACINYGAAAAPKEITERSICIQEDISAVLAALLTRQTHLS